MKNTIKLLKINKSYGNGNNKLHVLKDISLSIDPGEMVAIVGKSGSGKSTLLNLIGGIDKPDSGEYYFNGKQINTSDRKQMERFRRNNIGFVVQNFALINDFKVYDNIALPMRYQKKTNNEIKNRVYTLFESMDLIGKENEYPTALSGGEAQRVAIARALACNPELILADEPTGSLDEKTQEIILNVFREINKQGVTILIVTHDHDIARTCDRTVEISDGKMVYV
ncbi:MAG: ABC transporter ATP-binding protein [Tissierella sp.]|uniref:ABC transporter ATP-binding protein n=1 Tax=Tissierella sp. TaxID=41274 RepID=UPI003F9C65E1